MRTRTPSQKQKQLVWGQVMVEFVLAAVGIVLLAFLAVRVAQWLNENMVARNAQFQISRANAGKPGAGLVPYFVAPTELHLIGPGAAFASNPSAQGGGPSTLPKSCTSGHIGLANAARSDAANTTNARNDKVAEATKLTNDARCVIGVKGASVSFKTLKNGAIVNDGRSDATCYKFSANWYLEQAERLVPLENEYGAKPVIPAIEAAKTAQEAVVASAQEDVDAAQAAVNSAQNALNDAKAISCPPLTVSVCGEVCETDCSANTACKKDVKTYCNAAWPPGPDRRRCISVGNSACPPCVTTCHEECHDESTPDTVCETNRTNAINAAQSILNAAKAALTSAQNTLAAEQAELNEIIADLNTAKGICNEVMKGNPLVAPTKPVNCSSDKLRDYAAFLNTKAQEWMTRVRETLGPDIEALNKTIQETLDEANMHDEAARVDCVRGHD